MWQSPKPGTLDIILLDYLLSESNIRISKYRILKRIVHLMLYILSIFFCQLQGKPTPTFTLHSPPSSPHSPLTFLLPSLSTHLTPTLTLHSPYSYPHSPLTLLLPSLSTHLTPTLTLHSPYSYPRSPLTSLLPSLSTHPSSYPSLSTHLTPTLTLHSPYSYPHSPLTSLFSPSPDIPPSLPTLAPAHLAPCIPPGLLLLMAPPAGTP